MNSEIVEFIAFHLAQGDSEFHIARAKVPSELLNSRVFIPTVHFYDEYQCPCGLGIAHIVRLGTPGHYHYETDCEHEGFMQTFDVAAEDVELVEFDETAYHKCSDLVKAVGVWIAAHKEPSMAEIVTKSVVKEIKPFVPKPAKTELTQEDVAKDFRVQRQAVNRWEKNQTEDGPGNKSNKFGYYRSLRTNKDLRPAYDLLVQSVKGYFRAKDEAKRQGKRFRWSFVQFNESIRKHNLSI